jgi:hypothetical protein
VSHATESQVEKTVESFWQKGFATLKGTIPGAIYISFLAFVLPQIIYELAFAYKTAELAEISKHFTTNTGTVDFYQLLQPAGTYGFKVMFAGAVVWFVHVTGYFGIVHLCQCVATGRATPKVHEALGRGLTLTARRGLLALIVFAILFLIVQVLLPPAILTLLPGIMIPVLIASGTTGVFRPVIQALKMSYGDRFPGGRWALFFQLMSLGAFFYAGVLLVVFLANQILVIDTWLNLPRGLWTMQIASLPLSPMYLVSLIFKLASLSFIGCLLAAISVTFFTWVNRLPRTGIAV